MTDQDRPCPRCGHEYHWHLQSEFSDAAYECMHPAGWWDSMHSDEPETCDCPGFAS